MFGFGDGARLMRTSFELVKRDRELLWFPVASAVCLLLTAGFWLYEGAWLSALQGAWYLYLLLAVLGLYSLTFVAIFFSVALAGATAQVLDGGRTSFGAGVDVAWSRLGPIATWAGYSISVQLIIGFVSGIKGLRWVGRAAEVAWSFATFFVIPLIALDGLEAEPARRRSFDLAKQNWKVESGGLGALRLALVLPGLLFSLDAKLLFSGRIHSPGARALLALVLLCGLVLAAGVGVVRQVFAVSLYRRCTAVGVPGVAD
jgi:Family of unknown function (DUF6159)